MESRTVSALRLVGLARRAGAVAPGTDAVRRAIREGEAQLVLIASDASRTQVDKVRTTLHDRAIPQVVLGIATRWVRRSDSDRSRRSR